MLGRAPRSKGGGRAVGADAGPSPGPARVEGSSPRWWRRADAATWGLLLVAAAVLIVHSLRFDFVTDDAYISFVYSRNLAEHGELVFNLGDRVEGYSNFSWTVLLALLQLAGIGPELASRVLGTACGVAALAATARLTARALGRPSAWAGVPPLLLAQSSGFACWSSGGLETQLFTLLCVLSFTQLAAALDARRLADHAAQTRAFRRLGGALAAAALTRPEGYLLAAVVASSVLVRSLADWRAAGDQRPALWRPSVWLPAPARQGALIAVAAVAAHVGWRLWYYGWPLPNTYYVKAHGPWQPPELAAQMLRNGGYYLWTWARQSEVLWALPLVVVGVWSRRAAHEASVVASLVVFALAYLGYAASVGGDFMGLHRFLMPVFPVVALGVALGAARLEESTAGGARRALAAVGVMALIAFAASQAALTARSLRRDRLASDRGIDPPAFLIVYTQDRAAIGRALAPCLRADDFSIVGGAGALPYFARMRAIDVFGLVSDRVAHGEPRVRARAGHTKWGSDSVLASYQPTYVHSCYALHREPGAPALPCAAPWLARGFEIVTLHVPELAQSGTYYSFLARRGRAAGCPGVVGRSSGGP